jgi:hypothetical protein
MDLFGNLLNKTNSDTLFRITFGHFNKYYGSSDVDKEFYYNVMNTINKITNEYTYHSYKVYQNYNKILKVNKNNKTVESYYVIRTNLINNLCIDIIEKKKLRIDNFPYLNKYTSIFNRKDKTYKFNKTSISISFVEDERNDSIKRKIYIEFNNRDRLQVQDILSLLLD